MISTSLILQIVTLHALAVYALPVPQACGGVGRLSCNHSTTPTLPSSLTITHVATPTASTTQTTFVATAPASFKRRSDELKRDDPDSGRQNRAALKHFDDLPYEGHHHEHGHNTVESVLPLLSLSSVNPSDIQGCGGLGRLSCDRRWIQYGGIPSATSSEAIPSSTLPVDTTQATESLSMRAIPHEQKKREVTLVLGSTTVTLPGITIAPKPTASTTRAAQAGESFVVSTTIGPGGCGLQGRLSCDLKGIPGIP